MYFKERAMNTKLMIPAAGLLVCLGASAHADMYEMIFSGVLDSVADNRTAENDPYAGTVWGLDNYTAQVGDVWEYIFAYDSDTVAGDLGDDFAIYGLSFQASMSLNGNSIELMPNTQLYFIDDYVEIFGESADIPDQNSFVWTGFSRADGINELINGGELFTDEGIFAELSWNGFMIGANQGLFDVSTSGSSDYTVAINQIPTPSTFLMLGGTGLFAVRRRR